MDLCMNYCVEESTKIMINRHVVKKMLNNVMGFFKCYLYIVESPAKQFSPIIFFVANEHLKVVFPYFLILLTGALP